VLREAAGVALDVSTKDHDGFRKETS